MRNEHSIIGGRENVTNKVGGSSRYELLGDESRSGLVAPLSPVAERLQETFPSVENLRGFQNLGQVLSDRVNSLPADE